MNPHAVTAAFEAAVAEYTSAPYVVATNSCTAALLLACAWQMKLIGLGNQARFPIAWVDRPAFEIPSRTYVSVPASIIHAGGRPTFRDTYWRGFYQLRPFPVWDSARWFSGGMYRAMRSVDAGLGEEEVAGTGLATAPTFGPGAMVCVSFHVAKILGDTQGGAILLDDPEADAWLRRMRFDGRTAGVAPRDDEIEEAGHHCYLSPDVAARLLNRLAFLPQHNAPLEMDAYPDLSKIEAFN